MVSVQRSRAPIKSPYQVINTRRPIAIDTRDFGFRRYLRARERNDVQEVVNALREHEAAEVYLVGSVTAPNPRTKFRKYGHNDVDILAIFPTDELEQSAISNLYGVSIDPEDPQTQKRAFRIEGSAEQNNSLASLVKTFDIVNPGRDKENPVRCDYVLALTPTARFQLYKRDDPRRMLPASIEKMLPPVHIDLNIVSAQNAQYM